MTSRGSYVVLKIMAMLLAMLSTCKCFTWIATTLKMALHFRLPRFRRIAELVQAKRLMLHVPYLYHISLVQVTEHHSLATEPGESFYPIHLLLAVLAEAS